MNDIKDKINATIGKQAPTPEPAYQNQ